MRKRIWIGGATLLLAILATLVVWQGSFDFGNYGPESTTQVYLYWAVSTLVFLLTVTLGFMLFRTAVRIYIERQTNFEGSRIRTKLVVGALALVFLPVMFLVIFSIQVMNRNLDKWFSRPADLVVRNLIDIGNQINRETRLKLEAQARWLASDLGRGQALPADLCRRLELERAWIQDGDEQQLVCSTQRTAPQGIQVSAAIDDRRSLFLLGHIAMDLAQREREIRESEARYKELSSKKREFRQFYIQLIVLISLFILFFATWVALFLAKQLSLPIAALLKGSQEVRSGNLSHRVSVKAIDELAMLVRAFNEMTQTLEVNDRELERRRRFTEAILESIPTGVVSLAPDGRILRTNRALAAIFPGDGAREKLEDLLPSEEAAEIRYLMKRARRTGVASRTLDFEAQGRTFHLGVTLSALDDKQNSGFVLVLEDTSELLRAQKAAAWHEVARRIAHEIKNPLTPIALSAERLRRMIDRAASPGVDQIRIIRECSELISQEVESLRALVDEFAQFARFPAAQPRLSDLNDIIQNGLAVFAGRLDQVDIRLDLAASLPPLQLDPEQIKRVVVNLVDNAAEAMQDRPLRRLYITTSSPTPETVELSISDTGAGISPQDREKLFLPYFSTKSRGTGLGLAIVSHILQEHHALIRVEDNRPAGARFVIEFPVPVSVAAA